VAQAALGTRSGQVVPVLWSLNDPRCAPGRNPAQVNPPALARIVFHVLPDRTAVFAVGSNGAVRGYVRSIGRDALAGQVADLRDALNVDAGGRGVSTTTRPRTATAGSDYHAALRRFYDELIAPVADVLPAGETIVLEPHGPLWLVPFAALVAGDGTFLADRWPIVYSPSAQILDEIRREPAYQRPADLRALVVGNPTPPGLTRDDDARFRGVRGTTVFQPLPGAEQEARAIAAVLPPARTTLLVGSGADLATIEARASDATVVHLASHALAFPASPLDSFVMLAASAGNDGRLTARRVLGLMLSADLVTLSACQTGLGQLSGDGVIGLSRAFLVAGARSTLVSQWSVSDAATAALMTVFYREYAGGVEDKARALQRAMTAVRNQGGYDHPRYWAAFALIGSER
jgi:CHAT domain-containing protein